MRGFYLYFLLFITPLLSVAQGEGKIWHFGYNAGIDFNSGTAVAIAGYINTYEGCAAISSSSGTLLFCTDGVTVYDTNGGIMASGLMGNNSATQSAIIVPVPGTADQYYIFTVPAVGIGGLHYSIVDMTLNSGLGGLVVTNTPLVTPICEKITAVYAANGIDIWIIVHVFNTNEYYVYPVTASGVGAPVINSVGSSVGVGSSALGYLKASLDGAHLAIVGYGNSGPSNIFEYSDFDNSTGVISNTFSIPIPATNLYGVSFSPDNSKLYVSSFNTTDHIFQYDLTAANWWTNPYIVFSGGNYTIGALQIAPDGKIYVTENNGTALSTIDFPNNAGAACGFALHSFPILNNSAIGLPTFFEQLSFPVTCNANLGPDILHCGNDSVLLDAGPDGVLYFWSDGSSDQTLTVNSPGEYWVKKTFASGCIDIDTIEVHFSPAPIVSLGNDTIYCSTTFVVLDVGAGANSYLWNNGVTIQSIHVVASGSYSVTITDASGCSAADTIDIAMQGISVLLGNDTTICKGDTVAVNAGQGFSSYLWQNGSTDSVLIALSSGNYSVTVSDPGGCISNDALTVTISNPVVDLGPDTLLCNVLNYVLTPATGFSIYTWQNNSHNQTYSASVNGNYFLTVTNSFGCTASDSVALQFSNPTVSIGNDTTICINTSVFLIANSGFSFYQWNTNNTTESILISSEGTYSVTVTDNLGCKDSDSKIINVDAPFVFIGNDTSTCNGEGIVFDAGNSFTKYLWNDNSTLPQIVSTAEGIYSVNVTDANGCTANDTAIITYSDCIEIDIPTAFSPNGDGHNDFFHIINSYDLKSGEIKIYNRWGQLIYETADVNGYWNGKYNGADCEVGVYVFAVTGKNFLDHRLIKTGNVSLLR